MVHYCLHKFHWLPSVYLEMEESEKVIVTACILERLRVEEEEQKKLEKSKK